jgi:hypothetical protein
MVNTKKLATLALIVLLLSVSAAMVMAQAAQSQPAPAATTQQAGFTWFPPVQKEAEKAQKEAETTAVKTTQANTVTVYAYSDENGNGMLSTSPPDQFKKPSTWGTTTVVVREWHDINPTVTNNIVTSANNELHAPPVDVYDNKAVFQQGELRTIVDQTGTYKFGGGIFIDASWSLTDQNGEQIKVTYNPITEKFAMYNALGRRLSEKDEERIKRDERFSATNAEAKAEQLNKEADKRETVRAVMSVFRSFAMYFEEYKGLAGWSSLIFDKAWLQGWQDEINRVMCDTLGIAGNQCWASKICATYSDIKPPRNGVLYTNPMLGPLRPVAHIEGSKSAPIPTPNGTLWVYTVTFSITNPTDKEMTYNVRFAGPQRSSTWWKQPQVIPKGGTASALGASALIRQSSTQYDTVVLEFFPPIIDIDGDYVRDTRNTFVQVGAASAPYGPAQQTTTTGTPATTSPSVPQSTLPGADV